MSLYAGDEFYDDDVTSGLDRKFRDVLTGLARVARFELTPDEARARKCCIRCQDQIDDDWTTIDLREWELSYLCGSCFDEISEPA